LLPTEQSQETIHSGPTVKLYPPQHAISHVIDRETCLVEVCPWELHFVGSVCSKGQGIGCIITSPNGGVFDLSMRLEFACINNQPEYEAMLYGLEYLRDMGVCARLWRFQTGGREYYRGKSMSRWSFE
jgi:hypothetical protein